MGRLGRLLDLGIALAERAIDRVSDPSRERFLEECLARADHSIAELASENVRLNREHEALLAVVRESISLQIPCDSCGSYRSGGFIDE